jgi:hypothetical protein
VHPTVGHEHAVRVGVGDDRLDRQRLMGRDTRVQHLRAEDPLQTFVVEVRRHPLAHATEPTATDERHHRPPRPQ